LAAEEKTSATRRIERFMDSRVFFFWVGDGSLRPCYVGFPGPGKPTQTRWENELSFAIPEIYMFRFILPLALVVFSPWTGANDNNLAERLGLRLVDAYVWENRMPTATSPGEIRRCTPMIVRFSIHAGTAGFPPGVKAVSVSLSKPGATPWNAKVSAPETGISARPEGNGADTPLAPVGKNRLVLGGVARGCASPAFQLGDELRMGVLIVSEGKQATVQSTVKLTAAY
jgi:hypothetical protein